MSSSTDYDRYERFESYFGLGTVDPIECACQKGRVAKALVSRKGKEIIYRNRERAGNLELAEHVQVQGLGIIPVIIAAAATAYGAISGKKSAADQQRAAARAQGIQVNQALGGDYRSMAGSVPGRAIGLADIRRIMNALFDQNYIPPPRIDSKGTTKIWENMAVDFIDATGGKCVTSGYNCPIGIVALAKANPNASAADIVAQYAQSQKGYYDAELMGGNQLARQIFLDAADAALFDANPNAPITYGALPQAAPAPAPTPQALPAPTPQPVQVLPTPQPAQISPTQLAPTPQPSAPAPAQILQSSGVDPQTAVLMQQMMAQLKAQGANAQQTQAAMLQALAARGVQPTPQIQQATQAAVQTAGVSGSTSLWIAGGLAVLAVMFALARPAKGK